MSELLTEVQVLEARAADVGESSHAGRALLQQAAQLRVQALGERSYPVVVCSECFHVTGWVDANGLCDACVRSEQREAAYSDPHGGFVVLRDIHPLAGPAEPRRGPGLVGRFLGGRRARERALVETWMKRVEPDETGPIAPEEGFEIEVAHRDEVEAADGSEMLIRFRTATHRFTHGRWVPLETTRIGSRDLLVPPEHSAGCRPSSWSTPGSTTARRSTSSTAPAGHASRSAVSRAGWRPPSTTTPSRRRRTYWSCWTRAEGEPPVDRAAGTVERLRILRHDEHGVREQEIRVDSNAELLGILVGIDRALGLGILHRLREAAGPRPRPLQRAIAHRPRMSVHLGEHRGEEAAPGKTPSSTWPRKRSESTRSRSIPVGAVSAGSSTSSLKIALAVSIVASCSSSLEPKCAKSPLLLIPTASARRPIESPLSPSTVASCAASRRIALRLRSPSARFLRSFVVITP